MHSQIQNFFGIAYNSVTFLNYLPHSVAGLELTTNGSNIRCRLAYV
jgi:hypothetical protein